MPTGARKITGYSDISEQVLYQESIIQSVSRQDVMGTPGTTAVSVYVNALATVASYVPGTGVSKTNDGSAYVVLANLTEIGVNELLDGYTVETAPADLVASRFAGAVGGVAESVDTVALAALVSGGTVALGTIGTTVITITNFVVGNYYEVKVANSAADATVIGCTTATAIVGEVFKALTDGTGLTALTAYAVDAPIDTTIYYDVLQVKRALDEAKAPRAMRSLIINPEMEALLLDTDSKLVLNTDRGDRILMDGWIGRVAGFDVYSTTLMPSTTNFIGMQERGFAFKYNWKIEPRLQSLDGSGQFIGDSAIQARFAYNYGAVRATLIQINSANSL